MDISSFIYSNHIILVLEMKRTSNPKYLSKRFRSQFTVSLNIRISPIYTVAVLWMYYWDLWVMWPLYIERFMLFICLTLCVYISASTECTFVPFEEKGECSSLAKFSLFHSQPMTLWIDGYVHVNNQCSRMSLVERWGKPTKK